MRASTSQQHRPGIDPHDRITAALTAGRALGHRAFELYGNRDVLTRLGPYDPTVHLVVVPTTEDVVIVLSRQTGHLDTVDLAQHQHVVYLPPAHLSSAQGEVYVALRADGTKAPIATQIAELL